MKAPVSGVWGEPRAGGRVALQKAPGFRLGIVGSQRRLWGRQSLLDVCIRMFSLGRSVGVDGRGEAARGCGWSGHEDVPGWGWGQSGDRGRASSD